jgi:hypothetical protein
MPKFCAAFSTHVGPTLANGHIEHPMHAVLNARV